MNTSQYLIPLTVSGIFLITSPIIFIFLSYANGGLIYLFVKFVLQKPDNWPEVDMVAVYGNLLASVISLIIYFFITGRFGKVILSSISAFFICSFVLFLFVNVFKREIGFYFLPYIIGSLLTAIILCSIEAIKLSR
jgi:hypothetical protein